MRTRKTSRFSDKQVRFSGCCRADAEQAAATEEQKKTAASTEQAAAAEEQKKTAASTEQAAAAEEQEASTEQAAESNQKRLKENF